MSKYTKETEYKTDRLRNEVDGYRKSEYYKSVILKLSEVQNKDTNTIDAIKYKLNAGVQLAKDYGYEVKYEIVSAPLEPLRFNCVGCRKRKSGDYYNIGIELAYKDYDHNPWFRPLAKVCSKECGELMMLRLM